MDDLLEEDGDIREHLAVLALPALRELEGVLNAPQTHRDEIHRQPIARPELSDLAQLLAMADTREVVRLRLLRAIRDIGVEQR